jgi:adenylosuccinate synthase
MTTLIAVGAQWGDEGKGKIVDWIAPGADFVVRFHGGNNAGHTLVVDGEQTILHVVPAGIMNPDTINLIGPGVVVDPDILLGELDALSERGVLRDPARVRLSGRAHVILDWHRALDHAREERARGRALGTTGRGIGPAYEDKVARRGIRVADLLNATDLRESIERLAEEKNFELVKYYGVEPVDAKDLFERAAAWGRRLEPYVRAPRGTSSTSITAPTRTSPRPTAWRVRCAPAPASARRASIAYSASPRRTPRASAAGHSRPSRPARSARSFASSAPNTAPPRGDRGAVVGSTR